METSRRLAKGHPAAGRHAERLLEVAREMRLVRKSGIHRCLGQSGARSHGRFCPVQPAHDKIAMRAGPDEVAELPCRLVPVQAADALQIFG